MQRRAMKFSFGEDYDKPMLHLENQLAGSSNKLREDL
jgi:hypothetical protein